LVVVIVIIWWWYPQASFVVCWFCVLCGGFGIENTAQIVMGYEEHVRGMLLEWGFSHAPWLLHRRKMLGSGGAPNKMFITYSLTTILALGICACSL
jgi:hypothetical protein